MPFTTRYLPPLNDRMLRVYRLMLDHQLANHGRPPTIDYLQEATGFGRHTISRYIEWLAAHRYAVADEPYTALRARAIPAPDSWPLAGAVTGVRYVGGTTWAFEIDGGLRTHA